MGSFAVNKFAFLVIFQPFDGNHGTEIKQFINSVITAYSIWLGFINFISWSQQFSPC